MPAGHGLRHHGSVSEPLTGRLLVATPSLLDPNFERTVVLICAQSEDGAFGIVLNRPLEADVLEHLPAWRHLATSPPVVFSGGPVEPVAATALGRLREGAVADGWSVVRDRIGMVNLDGDPDATGRSLERLRVFSGYTGWGDGQLESEIAEGAWLAVDLEPDDPFTGEPERLWRRILRRQRGALAMYSFTPPDPSLN